MDKEFELNRAKAILNTAKNHDIVEDVLPDDDKKLIKLANAVVKQARRAYELGERGDHVTEIIFQAEVQPATETKAEPSDPDEAKYRELVIDSIEPGLPIPEEVVGEAPKQLPIDLLELSDKQVMKLHSAYSAYSARLTWLLGLEQAGESAAKFIADHKYQAFITTADRKDIGGKAKTNVQLKAEAEQADESLVKWREREQQHRNKVINYGSLLDVYDKSCDRLSRHWTMRQEEKERNR